MKVNKILRPNPNWEEDLENSTIIDSDMLERIKSYPKVSKIHKKKSCHCNDVVRSPGVSMWLPLNDGRWMPNFGLGTWLGMTKDDVVRSPGVSMWLPLNDGRWMPNFGLGTWLGMTKDGQRNKKKDFEVMQAVEWAIDAGYRHIDTAAIYGTEGEVGEGIRHKIAQGFVKRQDLFVCTKLWNDAHARDMVVPSLRGSLRRLNLSYVDLYLIHWPVSLNPDGSFSDIDYVETWQGMIDARNLGLAKSIGVSNFNEEMLDRLICNTAVTPAVLQIEVNLNLQQDCLRTYCCRRGIQIQGYTPFGSLFPNKATSKAPPPRIHDQELGNIARRHMKSPEQVVLRYILELGVVPIPKSVTKTRIEDNINIYNFQLCPCDVDYFRKFNNGYRTLTVSEWSKSPFYPFRESLKFD